MRQRTRRRYLTGVTAMARAGLTTILSAAVAFGSLPPGQWP
jgi:hypothetical protein